MRHCSCLAWSELLVVFSSELLIACQLSLWLCMSLPQWDTGTKNLCQAWYMQQAAARTRRGKVTLSGRRAWRDIALSQPGRCEREMSASWQEQLRKKTHSCPLYTVTLVFVYVIAATGGNPRGCCWGCRAQGGSHGLICSWNKVAGLTLVKTPPGSEG